jgi:hypothetical protein
MVGRKATLDLAATSVGPALVALAKLLARQAAREHLRANENEISKQPQSPEVGADD